MKSRRWLLWLSGPLAVVLIALGVLGGMKLAEDEGAKATYITYSYNEAEEKWERNDITVSLPNNPDGTIPKSSNTLIIRIKENDPVKLILIAEAVVKGGNEPIFEINGHDTGGSGKLNIANLVFEKVDAKKLEIDADVVHVDIENVAAEDNELDLDLEVVNVVRAGRGGTSVLLIGVTESDILREIEFVSDLTKIEKLIDTKGEGLRVDRIRILGPSSGTGFIENLIIRRVSVFGNIEVRDVDVNNLILKDVSLDDSIDSSIP